MTTSPWLMVLALVVIVIASWVFRKTAYGMRVYAVGGNLQAARYTGQYAALLQAPLRP